MIKTLFCHHEYVYVDKEEITHIGKDEYLFKFICKKCRKKFYISSLRIENIIGRFQHKLNEKKALSNYIDHSSTKIVIPVRYGYGHKDLFVSGYVADKTVDYFLKKYGVDISKIC